MTKSTFTQTPNRFVTIFNSELHFYANVSMKKTSFQVQSHSERERMSFCVASHHHNCICQMSPPNRHFNYDKNVKQIKVVSVNWSAQLKKIHLRRPFVPLYHEIESKLLIEFWQTHRQMHDISKMVFTP